MRRTCHWFIQSVVVMSAFTGVGSTSADDACYQVPLRSLQLTEGTLPADADDDSWWTTPGLLIAMRPYAVLDGSGEAHVDYSDPDTELQRWQPLRTATISEARLAARAPEGQDVTGRLFVPASDLSGMTMLRFRIPAASAIPDGRKLFLRAKQAYYEALLDRNIPGTAWFRHQLRETQKALGENIAGQVPPSNMDFDPGFIPPRRNWRSNDDLSDTYALFTGGRAMSENLQLDRILVSNATQPESASVDIETIAGISVQPMDWTPLVKDLKPELDPLAAIIPEDQHAIFFPSFSAMAALADEAEAQGTPVLRLVEVRSENALTRQRYERQLGLSLNALTRALGPQVVASVAITGSDPYYRTGTDVAILFEAKNPSDPGALQTLLHTQIGLTLQAAQQAKPVHGMTGDVTYTGAKSEDRSVCSYIATIGNAVVVTNSLAQLERLAATHGGKTPSIQSLPEYVFFRDRYRRSDSNESGLLFLSDATIRRWCGPRWRIATSRRMRDAAVMAELQATYLNELVHGQAKDGPIHTDLPLAGAGELRLTPLGVWSESYNTLNFLTPLVEVPLTKVTKAEAEAYGRWRDTYQRNWRQYFDPIALRLSVGKELLAADLSVMPLIAGSEYQELIGLTQGATIKPEACDPHDALAQVVMAINIRSTAGQRWGNFAAMMAPDLGMSPLDWLGQSISLYADPDPFWRELADTPDDQKEEFMERNQHRLPLALHAEVSNSLKLAVFLTALRAFVQQSAPGMVVWESLVYNEQPYVKVSATQQAAAEMGMGNLAIHYAASADGFVITFSEAVLKRALDRQIARKQGAATQPESTSASGPWLGTSLSLKATSDAIDLVNAITRQKTQDTMRLRAWGNIPILNEWKRRYPDQDPLRVHEQYWQTRLVCPGGGSYAWNEQYLTMESTVYGSPALPKEGPTAPLIFQSFTLGNFGVSFEERGVRARTELTRRSAQRVHPP